MNASFSKVSCSVVIGVVMMCTLLCGCAKREIPLSLDKIELPDRKQQILRRFNVSREITCKTLECRGFIDVADKTKRSDLAAILILRFFDNEGKLCSFSGLPITKILGVPAAYRYLPVGGGTRPFSIKVFIPETAATVEVGLWRCCNWKIGLQYFQCVVQQSVLRSLIREVALFCVEKVLLLLSLFGAGLAIIAVLIRRKLIPFWPFMRGVITMAFSLMAFVDFVYSEDILLQIILCFAAVYSSGVLNVISKMAWVEKVNAFFCKPIPEHAFDLRITNVCKGVAICLMLCYHCFELYTVTNPIEFSLQRGGNLCVPIFCFLSGFGLMRVKLRGSGVKMDLFHFVKLEINFLCVAAIWILFACLLEGLGFDKVYPNGWFPQFFFDILGFEAPGRCFCPTWWFMGAIIPLYLAFPFLSWLCRKSWPLLLVVALCAMFVVDPPRVVRNIGRCTWPFALGMVMAQGGVMEKIQKSLSLLSAIGLTVVTILAYYFRTTLAFISICEGFIALILVFGIYVMDSAFVSKVKGLEWILIFLGKHSMNIFLIHSYFNLFYKNFLRTFPPSVGFLMVLGASLLCSIAVEWLKYILGVKWATGKFKKLMT